MVLDFAKNASEKDLRAAIVECGQICYQRNLMSSSDGNLSVRLDSELVLITPSGTSKGRMTGEDLLVIGMDGKVHEGHGGRLSSSETPMHLEVYRQRPDVRAVIHAHPIFATALTVAGLDFPSDLLPEVMLALGEVPVTEYFMPSSAEGAAAIAPFVRDHRAILLRQHGSLTMGADLDEALIHLERIEHVAEVFWRARLLGHVERLTPQALERLRTARAAD